MIEQFLYAVSLGVVGVLCVFGLWSRTFKDNFLQAIGMVMIGGGCLIRLAYLMVDQPIEKTRFLVVYGLALYAIGTARKVWHYRGQR